MKKIIYFSIGVFCLFLNACNDTLDPEAQLALTEQLANTNYMHSQGRALAVYTYLPNGMAYINQEAMMAAASDEAEFTLETSPVQKFNNGSWNAIDNPDAAWSNNFNGIRAANLFLANSDNINLDYYKLDPTKQETYQTMLSNIERWKYEVRFLRAYFYFELVKRYGGVPLLKNPENPDSDYRSIPRSSLSECIQFIVDECNTTAEALPTVYPNEGDLGRVTKGAALALKSRTLLYAASDLFNDPTWAGGYADADLISMTDNKSRKQRWEEAAQAALDVIQLSGSGYALSANYVNLFKSYTNNEIIMAQRNGASNQFEKNNYPIGYDLGSSGVTPSQNLVDDYEMADGSVFDWKNPAHANNPYENRDPRLKYTVLTNNTDFKGRPLECWTGGLDGKGTLRATKTGYYTYKYIDPDLDLLQNRTSVHTWIIFRLAEVYLNYAEALNECDPGNSDIKEYVDRIRQREGVNMPTLPDGLTQQQMRERIRHERRIELALEDHRFWDVRRWMTAPSTLNIPLRGVEITNNNGAFSYNVIDVENRTFETKMYLYPIPQNDLNIATGDKWVQNPLW